MGHTAAALTIPLSLYPSIPLFLTFSRVTRALSPSFDRFRPAADGSDFGLRELMVVREIVHAFHTAERPGDVYQFALDRVTPLVGAAFACVYLVEKDNVAV